MIRVNISEQFPITVNLVDEQYLEPATGKTVYYDIRKQPGDTVLVPPVNGTLTESIIEPGIYRALISINEPGSFIVYASCTGFLSSTEDVIVESDNIANLIKQNRHYNTSVEDVPRANATPTASQTARKVGMGKTDYILTRIKMDSNSDWDEPTTMSGIVYAHYRVLGDDTPCLMGGEF